MKALRDVTRSITSAHSIVNNDTKHLNKLITSERGVWNSFSTLAYDQNEAAKYLSVWGKSEDIDLSDVTEKLGYLITKLAEAEGVLANHYSQYRAHLKEIRVKEDNMREQRSRRETLWSKIEKEERKANPSKRSETAEKRLHDYQTELDKLDKETLVAETDVADFKRERLHKALTVQFDAFLEFGQKLVIISKHCKKIIDQIPLAETRPGEPREPYLGKEVTSQEVTNAQKELENWALPQEDWTLIQSDKPHNYTSRSRTTISEDSIDDSLSKQQPSFVVTTPPQTTPNIEHTEISFNSSERKSSNTTFSDEISSSNAKYFEDPNEADHSDLDQTTDAEGDMSKVKENLPPETIAVIDLIPKPPTPPPKKDQNDELEPESNESKNQEVTFVSVANARTVGAPMEAQIIANEQVAELSSTIEIDDVPQQIDTEKLAPISSTTHSQRKESKHVHFSDVESEIP